MQCSMRCLMQGKKPEWLVNFNVSVMDVPRVGLYAGIRSPHGILFCVLERWPRWFTPNWPTAYCGCKVSR